MAWTVRNVIERLAEAGMLDPAAVTADDKKALGQLTEEECDQIIAIAKKIYGKNIAMVKITNLRPLLGRVCFPL